MESLQSIENNKADITLKAKHLAELLKQAEVYQELLRMGSLINMDPEVSRILNLMRQQQYGVQGTQEGKDLETQLLALPSYQAYMKAEKSTRELFQSVDQIISENAGINFAENAKRQGCGCGG